MSQVIINKKAQKQIEKLPEHIVRKLQKLAEDVEKFGLKRSGLSLDTTMNY